jgi:hypothetical protein
MKIEFGQIYVEVGTSFELSSMLLRLMRTLLDELHKEIPHFAKIFKTADFKLVFIITATRNASTLTVRGPTILRKNPAAEFALHIPFKQTADFCEKMDYLLPYLGAGVKQVLEKYKVDSTGVDEAIAQVHKEVCSQPLEYQYPKTDSI